MPSFQPKMHYPAIVSLVLLPQHPHLVYLLPSCCLLFSWTSLSFFFLHSVCRDMTYLFRYFSTPHTFCVLCSIVPFDRDATTARFKGGFVPAIHAAASMMEAGKGGDKEDAKAVQ